MVAREADPLADRHHREVEEEPDHPAEEPLAEGVLLATPRLREHRRDRDRHRDPPDEEPDESEHGPRRLEPARRPERRSHRRVQRMADAELTDEQVADARVLAEPGGVAEADQDQRDDRGEQLDREQAALRRAVDLHEASDDGGERCHLARLAQALGPRRESRPRPAGRTIVCVIEALRVRRHGSEPVRMAPASAGGGA